MSKIYITLTGTRHYFGNDFLKKDMKIRLQKEPDNEYDKEAIKVTFDGIGKIGYVANSAYTVLGDCMSAGRLYDKIGDTAKAKVVLVTEHGTVCRLCKKSLLENQKKIKKSEVK
ncbi:MAG: HIRAN domain-containing protein [Lachnospiraceae bacterium]|nr:HIRAN domain-containing protein [Lachnospiraceae bacterium]